MAKKLNLSGYLCPICFNRYRSVVKAYPMCGDCGSEAMEVEVVPLEKYLADTPLKELVSQEKKWRASEGFYESYKQEKLKRMAKIIELKKEFDSGAADAKKDPRSPKR